MSLSTFCGRFGSRHARRRGPRHRGPGLRVEPCEPRCMLAMTSIPPGAPFDVSAVPEPAAEVWTTGAGGGQAGADGPATAALDSLAEGGTTVVGLVLDGRLATGSRVYGFETAPGGQVFDVGYEVTGLAAGGNLAFEFLQGVTFWNGRGTAPTFRRSTQLVDLNFGNDTADVRIGTRRNVGTLLDVGAAAPGPEGPVVNERFDVTAGVGGNGTMFLRRAVNGLYAIVGRLVGDTVGSSAPVTFVFRVGEVTTEAYAAAIQYFRDRPPVSVFDAQTPEPGVYAAGQELRVTYRFSDPVTVAGSPRLPLTLASGGAGAQRRFATLDAAASTPTRPVFRYVVQANDGYSPRNPWAQASVQPTTGALQFPGGSAIRGANGGAVFPQATPLVAFDDVTVSTTRVVSPVIDMATGTYQAGATLWFHVEMNQFLDLDVSGGLPTIPIRAIGGNVIGQAEVPPGQQLEPLTSTTVPFRFTIPTGAVARQGIIMSGPITLNGGRILDRWGNDVLLTFNPQRGPGVRIAPA